MNTITDDSLKHHVKIMFVNELGKEIQDTFGVHVSNFTELINLIQSHLGLDEVGIDQDGVLKEFLEETIKHALNPSFGLFCVTEENKWLYPSPLSKIHYEHLDLFHYIGKNLFVCG